VILADMRNWPLKRNARIKIQFPSCTSWHGTCMWIQLYFYGSFFERYRSYRRCGIIFAGWIWCCCAWWGSTCTSFWRPVWCMWLALLCVKGPLNVVWCNFAAITTITINSTKTNGLVDRIFLSVIYGNIYRQILIPR